MPLAVPPLRRASRPAAAPSSGPPGSAPKGTLAAAGVAALAAAVLGVAALEGSSSEDPAAGAKDAGSERVVVADRPLERGAPLTGTGALALRAVPADEVKPGALRSLDDLRGRVASAPVPAGAQLTDRGTAADGGAVAPRLPAGQRAVTLPLDAAHGMAGDLRTADRVDVYGSFQVEPPDGSPTRPVLKLLGEDVRVLAAPKAPEDGVKAANEQSEVVLAMTPKQASEAAFTADNGKVWVAARAAGAATGHAPDLVTLESLLFGVAPVVSVAGGSK